MNKTKRIASVLFALIVLSATLLGINLAETAKADDDIYTNAYLFYQYVEDDEYKCVFADANFYYVTRAKAASSKNAVRYATVGWRITVNDKFYIDVKRSIDASPGADYLVHIDARNRKESGKYYNYNLYSISYENISKLLYNKYKQQWVDESNNEDNIIIRFDAIMSYKPR